MDIVEKQLRAIHLAVAAEAMALGVAVGLNPMQLYDVFKGSAAQSWSYNECMPQILHGKKLTVPVEQALTDIQDVLAHCRQLSLFAPITSTSEQFLLAAKAAGGLREYFEKLGIHGLKPTAFTPKKLTPSGSKPTVGFIGLGAMGLGMAIVLHKAGFQVKGFDVFPQSVEKFQQAGGKPATSAADAAKDVDVLVVMCANSNQSESIFFGKDGASETLKKGSVAILCATVSPTYIVETGKKLAKLGVGFVDSPVSGGTFRAADGDLAMMCSGEASALQKAASVILALAGKDENVYVVDGGLGGGAKMKMINQALADPHAAVTSEAILLGVKLGIDSKEVFEYIPNSQGASFMFKNRGYHMVHGDWTPLSATLLPIKDLGIIMEESRKANVPCPINGICQQLFTFSGEAGWAKDHDASLVRLWDRVHGLSSISKFAKK